MEFLKRITSLCPPYIHLISGSNEKLNRLDELIKKAEGQKALVKIIDGNNCKTREQLFEEFEDVLEFPDYFGHNWQALDECLHDLSWLPAMAYILIIKDFNKVLKDSKEDKKILIDILVKTCNAWASGQHYGALTRKPTPFHVLLHATEHTRVEILLLSETPQVHELD